MLKKILTVWIVLLLGFVAVITATPPSIEISNYLRNKEEYY